MEVVLVVLGAALVLTALLDAVRTTLTAGGGAGPVTARTGRGAWRLLLALSRHEPSRLLSSGGPLVLLLTVLTWILLLWAGWFLVFLAAGPSIIDASSSAPASAAAVLYYAGFAIFTLGVGDVVATDGRWQVLTAVASFLGLFLATLAITYVLNVVSAAVDRRSLAQELHVLGSTGSEILLTHWTGERFSSDLSSRLDPLRSQVLQTTEQHLAYPVLHFFHAAAASSAPRALAALDDALVLLEAGVDPGVAPGAPVVRPLRRALERYTAVVQPTGSDTGPPPLPSLAPLRDAGVPMRSDADFARSALGHEQRRTAVHRLVRSDAWTWPATTQCRAGGLSPRP